MNKNYVKLLETDLAIVESILDRLSEIEITKEIASNPKLTRIILEAREWFKDVEEDETEEDS